MKYSLVAILSPVFLLAGTVFSLPFLFPSAEFGGVQGAQRDVNISPFAELFAREGRCKQPVDPCFDVSPAQCDCLRRGDVDCPDAVSLAPVSAGGHALADRGDKYHGLAAEARETTIALTVDDDPGCVEPELTTAREGSTAQGGAGEEEEGGAVA